MKAKKNTIIKVLMALLLVAAVVLGSIKIYRVHEVKKSGILLSFDDYNAENWESYFDLFDEYDVKVTFFVNCSEPTQFCYDAIARGHEIGLHTASHWKVPGLSEAELKEQCLDPIETFREKGIELTTFSYPSGAYTQETNDILLQYYKVLRGAYYYEIRGKADLREGFVESYSIDNINHPSDEEYEESVTRILKDLAANEGAVGSLYSHAIDGGDWCVSEDHLIFLFEKAKELGLIFYTYQDMQNE